MQLIGHQGDVCFYSVDRIPEGLGEDQQTKLAILAYGEFSGHAHQLIDPETGGLPSEDVVEVRKAGDGLIYLNVKRRVGVVHGRARDFTGKEADHDYHNVVYLEPGLFATGIVEETDWLTRQIRRVVD